MVEGDWEALVGGVLGVEGDWEAEDVGVDVDGDVDAGVGACAALEGGFEVCWPVAPIAAATLTALDD